MGRNRWRDPKALPSLGRGLRPWLDAGRPAARRHPAVARPAGHCGSEPRGHVLREGAAEPATGELCNGWGYLKSELDRAFPEGQLRQLPRLYRGFFADVVLKGDVETLIYDIEKAARELEKGDPDTKVSDGMKGYWTLV